MDLTVVWAVIIAFAVAMYVVMDGFDLGIGILFPAFPVGGGRNRAMNSIAPVWDGNETWLVLGGGGLMAAFPLAYAIVLPALYAPLIAMLLGLVFRGLAFEFRWRDERHRPLWDAGFCLGSLVATFAQGITLGALLQGITIEGRAYAGGWWDWLSPFSLLTGASLVVAYALLGATWLVWKTEGDPHERARRLARWLLPLFLLMVAAVSLATPFLEGQYYRRWFEMPGIFLTGFMPCAFALVALIGWQGIAGSGRGRKRDWQPFVASLGLFGLTLAGLAVSIWPDVIPGRVTIWQAAAPYDSQLFMLVGAVVLVPLILAYTAWSYWVFRGKVGADGYH
jgi:cytochrome d ubiquinol oxidase subunit II